MAEIKTRIAEGGAREAIIRAVLYVGLAGVALDERRFAVVRQIRDKRGEGMSLEEFKSAVREQFFAVLLDEKAALAAIPEMLPKKTEARQEALEAVRQILTASGELEGEKAARMKRIEKLFA
jgi:hypothetical protein